MGIDTTIDGTFVCNIDELDDDFDISEAWEKFKKDNTNADICWELIDGESFEASTDYRAPPEFYVEGLLYIHNNFLKPNKIYVFSGSVTYSCCVCGTMCHGVINMTEKHVKLICVYDDARVTIRECDYNGKETLNFRDDEIYLLKKRIEELETEIKYSPDGVGYHEAKEHFDKLQHTISKK